MKKGCKPYKPVNEQLTVIRTMRFTEAQSKKFDKLGGMDWLRKQLNTKKVKL